MKIAIRAILAVILTFFLGICINYNYTYDRRSVTEPLTLSRHDTYKYVILIPYHQVGRDHPHPIGCPSKYERDGLHSLGINLDKGRISGETIFINENAEQINVFSDKLKGHIKINERSIEIALEQPYYTDGEHISHYVPYQFNGEYTYTRNFQN